jgi:hypothetical protein
LSEIIQVGNKFSDRCPERKEEKDLGYHRRASDEKT